jgi:hypothetical protein
MPANENKETNFRTLSASKKKAARIPATKPRSNRQSIEKRRFAGKD